MWEWRPPPPTLLANLTADGEVLLDRAATATGDPVSYIAPPPSDDRALVVVDCSGMFMRQVSVQWSKP
jgi:hypothetical protein